MSLGLDRLKAALLEQLAWFGTFGAKGDDVEKVTAKVRERIRWDGGANAFIWKSGHKPRLDVRTRLAESRPTLGAPAGF